MLDPAMSKLIGVRSLPIFPITPSLDGYHGIAIHSPWSRRTMQWR